MNGAVFKMTDSVIKLEKKRCNKRGLQVNTDISKYMLKKYKKDKMQKEKKVKIPPERHKKEKNTIREKKLKEKKELL